MFIFKLNGYEETSRNNYPKYTIIMKNTSTSYYPYDSIFYYLIVPMEYYKGTKNKFPTYFILLKLFFDIGDSDEEFDLSKLGADYIVNKLGLHFQNECKGSYPDNYVFVIEPHWPVHVKNVIDRSTLKRSYHLKNIKG